MRDKEERPGNKGTETGETRHTHTHTKKSMKVSERERNKIEGGRKRARETEKGRKKGEA